MRRVKKRRVSPAFWLPVFIGVGMLISVIVFMAVRHFEEPLTGQNRVAVSFIGGVTGFALWCMVFNWRETFLSGGNPWG